MRSQWIFMTGFLVLLGGILAALWKLKVLERIGAVWTLIIIVIAVGIGIMLAVAKGGREIRIDK